MNTALLSTIKYTVVLVVALAVQWLFTSDLPKFDFFTRHDEPPTPSAKSTPIARNEREINRQQQQSARRVAALVAG